ILSQFCFLPPAPLSVAPASRPLLHPALPPPPTSNASRLCRPSSVAAPPRCPPRVHASLHYPVIATIAPAPLCVHSLLPRFLSSPFGGAAVHIAPLSRHTIFHIHHHCSLSLSSPLFLALFSFVHSATHLGASFRASTTLSLLHLAAPRRTRHHRPHRVLYPHHPRVPSPPSLDLP
ncbi:hypothetical protein DFH09DRAFT_1374757, partial [Mycena vulgaris]